MVDASSRMLLVESDSDPEALRSIVDDLPDWIMAPEQSHSLPDRRPKIEGPPD